MNCRVHILTTDKSSSFIQNHRGILRVTDNFTQRDLDFIVANFINIYITSDEEISEGDYIITLNKKVINVSYLLSEDVANGKKIILTTDVDLIVDGVQAIPEEFLEWFVKNPSREEVDVNYENYKEGVGLMTSTWRISEDDKYKIIITKEESKQVGQITEKGIIDTVGYCPNCGVEFHIHKDISEPKKESKYPIGGYAPGN